MAEDNQAERSEGGIAGADVTDSITEDRGVPVGRRIFLGLLGLGAVGIVTGKAVQNGLSDILAPIQLHDPTGITALIPTGNGFRYYSVTGGVKSEDAQSYSLEVKGSVSNPVEYSLAQLGALPQTSLTRDFQCVTGWRVSQVAWSGVKLADIIKAANPSPTAKAVHFTSFDGTYTESLSMEQAMRDDVLVASSMLGAPVTHNHGGPVRLYVAPMYGYKSCKWLSGIEITDDVVPGYWETRGYDVDGWVGTSNGRSDDATS